MMLMNSLAWAVTIEALVRVSLILAAGLVLSLAAHRRAALRHAILLCALVAAFLVPAAMLIARTPPASRWRIVVPEGLLPVAGAPEPGAWPGAPDRPLRDGATARRSHRPPSRINPAAHAVPESRESRPSLRPSGFPRRAPCCSACGSSSPRRGWPGWGSRWGVSAASWGVPGPSRSGRNPWPD